MLSLAPILTTVEIEIRILPLSGAVFFLSAKVPSLLHSPEWSGGIENANLYLIAEFRLLRQGSSTQFVRRVCPMNSASRETARITKELFISCN